VPNTPISFSSHDHGGCVSRVMSGVEKCCADQDLKLTDIRRHVLEVLLESHKGMGAYEILDRLRVDGFSSQPPTAYRALDFLMENGFVHKIEGLNLFAACMHPDQGHDAAFLICGSCKSVSESIIPRNAALGNIAQSSGFTAEKQVLEAHGTCADCHQGAAK
jgi:Fur family zinc uptake transcriptional regulator